MMNNLLVDRLCVKKHFENFIVLFHRILNVEAIKLVM